MEILHFCPSRSFSGLEQYAFEMAADQRLKGRKVAFVVCPGSRLEQECKNKNIETVSFDPDQPLANVRFWPRLRRLMIKNQKTLKVFHLHSTQEVNHLWGAVAAQKLLGAVGPRVILQTHIWINHKKKDPLHWLEYLVVDEIWCSSAAARESLMANLPISRDKIKIINYGRNVTQMQNSFLTREAARAALNLPVHSTIVGCVSRVEKSKGIKEFLLASEPLLKNREELHLAVIGAASPANPESEAYLAEVQRLTNNWPLKIKERVHWLGAVSESYKYLKAFDLYVLPSYQETFSLALLDAQLAKLPVVGGESGGTPDVVINGSTGWLFEPKNTADLGKKLYDALSNRAVWPAYGQTAQERVLKNFDQKIIFQSILERYERV